MHTPVYDCFYATLKNSGCEVLESPLSRVGDSYAIDFDAFERLCAEEHPALYLLCNPHNPAGRVWTREELTRISTICHRHHLSFDTKTELEYHQIHHVLKYHADR